MTPSSLTLTTLTEYSPQLWNVATRQQIGEPLTGQAGAVTSVAFSPGGTTLATGSDDHTVRLWNVSS
jgi:WD40 repeat protein